MRKIVYYVAISLDGFISGPDEDISGFVGEGDGLSTYLADLADYDTVIMGRKTYELGYRFGLEPGQPAYPHMKHYIFSNNLTLNNPDRRVEVRPIKIEEIERIREQVGTDIYLCGGGQFAGWLLENDMIDVLKIKLNPLVLGRGVRIFGDTKKNFNLKLIDTQRYDHGLQIMTYKIK